MMSLLNYLAVSGVVLVLVWTLTHLTRLYPIDHGIIAAMPADFLDWLHRLMKVQ